MTAIYTKHGLTVHLPLAEEIEYLTKSILTTVCLAIENMPDGVLANDKGSISNVVRFVADIIPTEYDYTLMLLHKDNDLKTSLSDLGIR